MSIEEKVIYVFASWIDVKPILIGKLYAQINKGNEIFSFEYDDSFLAKYALKMSKLDPNLCFYKGRQYADGNQKLFGIFTDSCPDRFGRMLINRRESILAKKENRKPNKLNESDYLLGVYDNTRMGGLRFSLDKGETFLANDKELITPPFTSLRTLENASIALENENDENIEKWLEILLAPGSSLGGARPKANVIDTNGDLWIAKFPSKHDEYDSGLWEMVVHDLALMCGIDVPEARIEQFSTHGHTFLVKRFDRENGNRVHFSSAMNLLNHLDGEKDISYLELVSFIKSNSVHPLEDLNELFKRIAFFISISNTDDHLRNHGFLLEKKGWKLSPLYDVNPNPYGNYLSINIDDCDSSLDYNLLLSTAKYYEIEHETAIKIIKKISDIVKNNWENIAKKYGASHSAIEFMSSAFIAKDLDL